MKVTTRGRITIPTEIRDRLGIVAKGDVDFNVVDGEIFITKRCETAKALRRLRRMKTRPADAR